MPIRSLLLCLQDKDPFLAPGAPPDALIEIAEALEDMDAPALPADFALFLRETNGFVWNGIQIFGAVEIIIEKPRAIVPALPAVNDSYASSLSEMRDRLLLGRSEDDLYVYDSRASEYWILDRHGLEAVDRFPSFLDLLRQVIEERR
jgi:hypothetical protein